MKNPEWYDFNEFSFQKMELDKNKQWFLTLLVKTQVENVEHKYTLLFRYDTERIEMRIGDAIENKHKELGEAMEALDGMYWKTIEEITRERDTRIAELEADLENVLRWNKDLLFSGYIKKVDYKGNGTQITFGIYSDELPEQINKLKHILHNYQVTMIEK